MFPLTTGSRRRSSPSTLIAGLKKSEGWWIQDQMLGVKPSTQCFDGILEGKKNFKKKGKSLFVNVLDRKTPARDKGSAKKKSASSRWCFKCWMKCISKGGIIFQRENLHLKWQGTECKSAPRVILKTGPVQTQAQAPSSKFSEFSSKQKLAWF